MNKHLKAFLCALLSACMIISVNAAPICASRANAAAFVYPSGVSSENATLLAEKADTLIVRLSKQLGMSIDLKQMLTEYLCADSTMNMLLLSLYGASEGQTSAETEWLNVTPQTVAAALEAKYPSVAAEIGLSETWSEVKLDNAKWNIIDDTGFADAVGTLLIPFSEFLMTLLCATNYKILGNIIRINGNNGYEDAVIPAFEALGCTSYLSYSDYVSAAKADKASLGANIVLPLLRLVDQICEAPVGQLSELLPNAAYFISSGGVEKCVAELMRPFTELSDNILIKLFAGKSISALNSLTDKSTLLGNFSENLIPTLNKMLADSNITLPDINWELLAGCGSLTNGKVIANKGQSFVSMFRYLWKTLSLNKQNLGELMSGTDAPTIPEEYSGMLLKLLDASADDVLSLLCSLMFFDGKFSYYPMTYGAKSEFTSAFAENMTRENYTRMLNNIDRVLYMAVAEFAEFDDAPEYLRGQIFSGKTVWLLCSAVYSFIEQADMSAVSDIINLDFSPAYAASLLTESDYSAAKAALSRASSWASLKGSSASWGFKNGDIVGFINSLSASLRPVQPVLRLLLAGGSIEFLDTFTIHGGYGYNNAVIPLLEALGCNGFVIFSNDDYLADAQTDGDKLTIDILFPVAVLLDSFCDKPVKTLTEILPNIIYFVENGGITQCIGNLLKPLTELLEMVEKVIPIENLDSSSLTNLNFSLDSQSVSGLLSTFASSYDMPIHIDTASLDLSSVGGMGELVQLAGKADANGQTAVRCYIEADSEEVLAFILRFAVQTIKSEENSALIGSLFSTEANEKPVSAETVSGEEATTAGIDMNSMFSSSASEMLGELKAMSVDETVCWIYHFFFREHAVPAAEVDNSYIPAIKYVDTGSDTDEFEVRLRSAAIIFCISVAATGAVAAVVIFAARKRKSAKKETH